MYNDVDGGPRGRRMPFVWHAVDLRPELPVGWQLAIHELAERHAAPHELLPTSVTSRESVGVTAVPVLTVDGGPIALELPWLQRLYTDRMRVIAEHVFREPVATAVNESYGINLNIQRGASMRYEAHVDSNPIGGLLYTTDHPAGGGGELVVSNRGDVSGIAEIEEDCTRIHPVAGHFVLFDARRHSHYVAPLADPEGLRIVVAMNFYTASAPESARPADLNGHLFGPNHNTMENAHAQQHLPAVGRRFRRGY